MRARPLRRPGMNWRKGEPMAKANKVGDVVACVHVPPCGRCGAQPMWKLLVIAGSPKQPGGIYSQLQHFCNYCMPAKGRAFVQRANAKG